jgi:hypothetical protein
MTIAVVGNGPSAISKKNGHLIDQFDEVIRFNSYQLNGYEQYVGTKTTIWVRGNKPLTIHLPRPLDGLNEVIIPGASFINPDYGIIEWLNKAAQKTKPPVKITLIPHKFYKKLAKEFKEGPPTAGCIILAWLLRTHDKIYITGFNNNDRHGTWHYWASEQNWTNRGIVHNSDAERRFMEKLIAEGKVKII